MTKSDSKWKRVDSLLEEVRKEFDISESQLRKIAKDIGSEMFNALTKKPDAMINLARDYLVTPPQGNLTGTFYGVDFGCTYLRISRVKRGGRHRANECVAKVLIPEDVKEGHCAGIFDFIALELKKVVDRGGQSSVNTRVNTMLLGVSFAFPVMLITESTGKWAKGFPAANEADINIAGCLQQAMDEIGLHMRIAVLENDTVSTLCFGCSKDPDTVVAVVIGASTNVCYLDKACIFKRPLDEPLGETVVDVEWGDFYSANLRKTSYDKSLDADSSNPDELGFDKLTSGIYLGEIVRRVILRMLQDIGQKSISERLSAPFKLTSQLVAEMNQDESPNLDKVAQVFRDIFEVPKVHLEFRRVVKDICGIVARRWARFIAASICGILKVLLVWDEDSDEDDLKRLRRVIVIDDGGQFDRYFAFEQYLREAVRSITGQDADDKYTSLLIGKDDEQVTGAALLAAYRSTFESGGDAI